ncbi:MAG TPA: hypothetical protein PL019_09095 [Caldisericia bacterium]|nr:hypothetical protein [Caldisericia bacterium]
MMRITTVVSFLVCLLLLTLLLSGFNFTRSANAFPTLLDLQCIPGDGNIDLVWDDSFPGYWYMPNQIISGKKYPLKPFAEKTTTFRHTGLENGKEYCYIIDVVNDNGETISSSNQCCSSPYIDCSDDKLDRGCSLYLCYQIGNPLARRQFSGSGFENVIEQNGFIDSGGKLIANRSLNTSPSIINNSTFLPPRDITDLIPAACIHWENSTKQVTMIIPSNIPCEQYEDNYRGSWRVIVLTIGKNTALLGSLNTYPGGYPSLKSFCNTSASNDSLHSMISKQLKIRFTQKRYGNLLQNDFVVDVMSVKGLNSLVLAIVKWFLILLREV